MQAVVNNYVILYTLVHSPQYAMLVDLLKLMLPLHDYNITDNAVSFWLSYPGLGRRGGMHVDVEPDPLTLFLALSAQINIVLHGCDINQD